MLNVLTPLSVSCVCLVYAVRLLSALFVSCVYLLRLSRASISCVYLVRLCLVCAAHITPLHSFKHVKRVNSFKRLSRSSRLCYAMLCCSTLCVHLVRLFVLVRLVCSARLVRLIHTTP